jgi:NhaP-type Na+/H+ or K+/H+ antiporter
LGIPLWDHHWYATKRGDRAAAHVICRSLGPYGAHIFSPRDWGGSDTQNVTNAITLEVTRVVLAVGVFAIGVELPSKYMQKHARSLLFL